MTARTHRFVSFCAAMSLAAAAAFAQSSATVAPPPPPDKPEPLSALKGRPDVDNDDVLGGTYQNPTAGIAFRTPGVCEQQKGTKADEIVRFVNPKKQWELVATRSTLSIPMKLSGAELGTRAGSPTSAAAPGKPQAGLLQVIAGRLQAANPGVEIVRQDVVNLGESQVGIIAARQSAGQQRQLLQQAIIQANDQLYYLLAMTSPAAKDAKGDDTSDANETAAVNAFRQVLDSVKLLDRAQVKDDQNERLIRTRAFFVNLTPNRMRSALIPEQWMRLIHDGRDIGYTYTVEEPDASAGPDGIKIGVRSRSYPDQNTQVDGETWYYVAGDRKHENWSNVMWIQYLDKKTTDQITEFGSSDATIKRVLVPGAQAGEGADAKQPPVQQFEVISLDVQTIGKSASVPPLKQDLPPWYLPQGLSHLLPRLLPLREPKTFMFAVYVGDAHAVMHRYVDVGSEQVVELNGQQVRAVPITDRIRLEGTPTIHYLDPDSGKYLGSVNKESKFTILPSTSEELQKIWANKADLSRPRQQPNPRARTAAGTASAADAGDLNASGANAAPPQKKVMPQRPRSR